MNQILSTSIKSNEKKKKMTINSVLIMFSVMLMVMGIGTTASGAYSFYRNLSEQMNNDIVVVATEPQISIERVSASVINIVVTHDKGISTVAYTINNGNPTQILGDGKQEVKKQIELQNGTSTISVTAKDVSGVSSTYETTYSVEKQAEITLGQVDAKIQAKIKSETELSYIEYYWDDNEEEVVHNDIEENKKNAEVMIDVIEGEHVLNIKVVDINDKETTKTQKILGDNKPELKVRTNGEKFFITASDDQGLNKVEITLNGGETITKEIDTKEYSDTVELEDIDVNRIIVVVYNVNGLSETMRVQRTRSNN